jgi:hypothetical protein
MGKEDYRQFTVQRDHNISIARHPLLFMICRGGIFSPMR